MHLFTVFFACIVFLPRLVWPLLTIKCAATCGAVLLHFTVVLYSTCHVLKVWISLFFLYIALFWRTLQCPGLLPEF